MEIDDDFMAKLNEISSLYVESKKAIILLENYNPEHKTFIAPMNEMRNALDHIMKMIANRKDSNEVYEQYRGARSHIRRAGYDAYELLCISISDYIRDTLSVFSPEDIAKGFPQYYGEIRPRIQELKGFTAKLRERREDRKRKGSEFFDDDINVDENTYKYYFESYEQLNNYSELIGHYVSGMLECKQERLKKEKLGRKAFNYTIIGIILSIILFIAGFIIGKIN